MTDSTTDTSSGEDALEVGPSADELFGAIADGSLDDEAPERSDEEGASTTAGETEASAESRGPIEDKTARDVFDQLRDGADHDAADVLEDESPEDIIASADEPDPEPDADLDDVLLDEEALEDLLLTDRTKEDGFLWIDADEDDPEDVGAHEEARSALAEKEPPEGIPAPATAADETGSPDSTASGPASPDSADSDDVVSDAADAASGAQRETALVHRPTETDLEPYDDEPDGVLGWIRAKLSNLF